MSRYYESQEGYDIEYPNKLAYTGMPAIVRLNNLQDSYIGVGVTIQVGDYYYTETRTPYNGAVVFDISRYMQLAFEGKSFEFEFGANGQIQQTNLAQDVNVIIQLTNTGGEAVTALQFAVRALLGYIAYGQSNGGTNYRKLFANYPQTFDFYATDDTTVTIECDNGDTWALNRDRIGEKQVSVELSRWWSIPDDARTAVLSADITEYLNGDELVEGESEYNLTIDRSKSGVFVRWINHFGQWCYYLFRRTGRNYTTSEVQTWRNGALRSDIAPENNVVQSSEYIIQQLEQRHTIALGVKLVDAVTFDFLLSIVSSPRVEVLLNADDYHEDSTTKPVWERVNIVAGSYARTNAPLQDFNVSIARTAQKTQML